MFTVVPGAVGGADDPRSDGPVSLIDELVRQGARKMLAEALQAEVDDYVARFTAERDEKGAGWWYATARTSLVRS